ncbi:MAG: murein hydrolase activator EnvC family protein [Clostridia bacterium]
MKKNKIISVLLIMVFILNLSIVSFANDVNNINSQTNTDKINIETNNIEELTNQKNQIEEKIDKTNVELEYVQTEMSATLVKIQELDDKIRKYENENAEFEKKINELEESIKQTTEQLNVVIEDYNKKDNQLRERLAALYEAGPISYLDVLLSAKSLSEFLSIYYKMVEIAEYDNKLIDIVLEEKNAIIQAKQKLENESEEFKNLKVKAEQNTIVCKNTKTLQEGYVKQLSDNEKQLNEKIAKYKNETEQIEAKIREISIVNGEFSIQNTGGIMIWPVAMQGTAITSYYGTREHPIAGVVRFHQGIDIGNVGFGAPVVATLDGVVTYAGELGSYGECVIIYHGEGVTTLYGHGQKVLTQIGAQVKQGDAIMQTGSTGNSTGPHLHFEVRINGSTINPLNYVKEP